MKKILTEDDVVFDCNKELAINPLFVSTAGPISKVLADEINDWDITDRTKEFKTWVKNVKDVIDAGSFSQVDFSDAYDDFIEYVLNLNKFGAEVHAELKDFGIELKLDEIKYTSDVVPPNPNSKEIQNRTHKHIVHLSMDQVFLTAWKKDYIRAFTRAFIETFLLDAEAATLPIDDLINKIRLFWVWEHVDSPEEVVKEIRKIYYDLMYARGHKDFTKAHEIKLKLSKMLAGVDWEMTWRYNGATQKVINRGTGLLDSLWDVLTENDIEICSFKLTGDF